MKVSLKIYDVSISEHLKFHTFELPDGSTVETLAYKCADVKDLPYDREGIVGFTFMVNNSLAPLSTVLNDGDQALLLRPMEGG